ncbi:orotidine-5'-phosphate decarboxylase [Desulfohalotomaculum tongense]|uniref:orotidine-5'-phosphate decarboxylase n=1 Tax=Desulforadius tongensis TaxID=1216062 RepID=UPI00195DC6C5|nr:orotidine-5'-phosphate decarboxylase [Desulforadius tongensis]MBM7855144.1 orotidine-5'-phosphate decarboxylase [Desulforadius tongensis]
MGKRKLIAALDVDSLDKALSLVDQLASHVGMFKVGMELYNAAGPEVVRQIRRRGGRVFLDLKLHDIPTTVARTTRVLTRLGVSILNIHAGGGLAMMQAAASAVQDEAAVQGIEPPQVIAVTVLTSMDEITLNTQLNIPGTVEEQVLRWTKLAQQAGLHGVVCSPLEIKTIRETCGPNFTIVTPGIRPAGSEKNDQRRVMTPAEAVKLGATYLVVGRPITAAENPAEAARAIVKEIESI